MSQLTAVCQKTKPAVRKRIRDLREEGFVEAAGNEFGQNFGRPETLLGLTEQGVDLLKGKKLIAKDMLYENIGPVNPRLVDHQFLLNWFRVHLNQTGRVIQRLNIGFLAYNSPFVPRGPDGRVVTADSSAIGRRTIREVKCKGRTKNVRFTDIVSTAVIRK